jgi:phosphatidate cytidylyltransferase
VAGPEDPDAVEQTPEGRRFLRPWEEEAPPAPSGSQLEEALPDEEVIWNALELASGAGRADLLSTDELLAASTREYQGLAEDVARAQEEVVERQAVAAAISGVGSGLVGFEDVTGIKNVSEEEFEHEEQQRASDLALRVSSALVLLGLFVGSLFLGGFWFSALVVVIMLLSAGELFATLRSKGYRPLTAAALLGLLVAGIGVHRSGMFALVGGITVTLLLVAVLFSFQNRRHPLENAAVTVMGTAWIGMLSFAIAIGRSDKAVALILFVVLVTAGFDIGAYFVGRAFGRRPIAPVVSPQKTLEGLIGGVIAAFGLAAVLSTLPPFNPPITFEGSLLLAGVIALLAPLGDAAESVVKRSLDVKDMGSILPGHGGMLDRIDALLFVVPAAYLVLSMSGYL